MADQTIKGEGPWTITVTYPSGETYSNVFVDRDRAEGALAFGQQIHSVAAVTVKNA